jgi:hypothetical protein
MMAEGSAMACGKRPNRNWKEYNERLVEGGEILLDVKSLRGWREGLKGMNLGENGRPFQVSS